MHRYLSNKVADYTADIFDVAPNGTLLMTGKKHQVVSRYDDSNISVASIADSSGETQFRIQLQFMDIQASVQDYIFLWWHSPAIANGRARTFYFKNHADGKFYTARFLTALTTNYLPYTWTNIDSVTLLIEGNMPAT